VHWIRGNPWIVLTLRYRTDDQLWFSLFHEIGHLLEGGRRPEIVEEVGDEELPRPDEQSANAFAREALLPQDELDRWLTEDAINRGSTTKFAASQGVAPGIVVGRRQRDRRLKPSELNRLKRHFDAPPAVENLGRVSRGNSSRKADVTLRMTLNRPSVAYSEHECVRKSGGC
jgi:HTH-type transcriptional regulator/antitoxin HigA